MTLFIFVSWSSFCWSVSGLLKHRLGWCVGLINTQSQSAKGAKFPEVMPNPLGHLAQGCQVTGSKKKLALDCQ